MQPLREDRGSPRAALISLYSLFATTRDVLRRMAGETAGPLVLPGVAANLVDQHPRQYRRGGGTPSANCAPCKGS
ncbi:hypothetical protein [Streptomyces kebangsaanensis]|uniref:hypothetical protein n=1 Tax=Streptomyces kebangsaanensis TaxID=864058 RepID=UPI00093B182B|nr:hypothetical protein [Streptomyces kebangsaanensis]